MNVLAPAQFVYRRPGLGRLAPWFQAPSLRGRRDFNFSSVAGCAMLMLFFGHASEASARAALTGVMARRELFDDERCSFYGVTIDPSDEAEARIGPLMPGIRFFLDYEKVISRLYGALPENPQSDVQDYKPHFVVIDRQMRIAGRFEIDQHEQAIAQLEEVAAEAPVDDWAPVLHVPRVFEPALCRRLIELHQQSGVGLPEGTAASGFSYKRRSELLISDESLRKMLSVRLKNRLAPMLERALGFSATRIERYIVACYDAETGGYFMPHRDNTTPATAHRRYAVTINLNAEEYEGGDLRFPEFGQRAYRAQTGEAIVYSCSLLHQALPVTEGRRYAFLPFLYDEVAAKRRMEQTEVPSDTFGF